MNWKSLGPLIVTSVLTVLVVVSPTLTALVAKHPDLAAGLVIAAKALNAAMPSIFQKPVGQ